MKAALISSLFWVVIAWISATVITAVIFFIPFYIPGFLKEISRLVQAGSYSYTELGSAVFFVPMLAGIILALPVLSLAILAGKYSRISSFLLSAVPILALILGIIVWFSSAATKWCGLYVFYFPGWNPTVCGFGDLFKAVSIEFSVIFVTLSILPTAIILRREKAAASQFFIIKSLRYWIVVLIALTLWAFVSASPYLLGQTWALGLQKEQSAKIELAKKTFILEPSYLPANILQRDAEWPADEGIVWKYTCDFKPNAFSITQEPLSSVKQRLSQYAEKDKAWEALLINGKKALYRLGSLYWETDNSFIKIESSECGHSKEELIKVAESMKPYNPTISNELEQSSRKKGEGDRLELLKSSFTVLEPTYIPESLRKNKEYEFVGSVESQFYCDDKDKNSSGLLVKQWPLGKAPKNKTLEGIREDLGSNQPDANGIRYKDIYPPGEDKLDIKYTLEEISINGNKAIYVELRTAAENPQKPTTRQVTWVQGDTLVEIHNALSCLLSKEEFLKIAESMKPT